MFQIVPIIALLGLAAAFAARVCHVYRLRVARRQGETGGRPKSQFLAVDGCLVKPVRQFSTAGRAVQRQLEAQPGGAGGTCGAACLACRGPLPGARAGGRR